LIYDGEVDDPSFEPARTLWPMRDFYYKALGHKWKEEREYQVMLKTVFAVAGKESAIAQRAVAWVILNRAKENRDDWGGNKIEGVCKALRCWTNKIIVDTRNQNDTKSWNEIDQWLPNVELELNRWDPSRGSLDFLKHPQENSVNGVIQQCDIRFGNLKFYKNPVSMII